MRPGIGHELLISDTIGFIQDLPPQLIEAFSSTLDETIHADLLLHVLDVSDPHHREKKRDVEKILAQLGVHKTPRILILNKLDRLSKKASLSRLKTCAKERPILTSSTTGDGCAEVKEAIRRLLIPNVA